MAIGERRATIEDGGPSPWGGQRMTLDEFLALPDVSPHLEYDDGVVTQKVAARPVHGAIQQYLAGVLGSFARSRRSASC